jgi:hypothetical protein
MEPKMTVTLTVHARGGDPGLLVTLPGGEHFNLPLGEKPELAASSGPGTSR